MGTNKRGDMVIYLPGAVEERDPLDELTPRQIVEELDKTKSVRRLLSDQWRLRSETECGGRSSPLTWAEDVMPKNIIMIGPYRSRQNRNCQASLQVSQCAFSEG